MEWQAEIDAASAGKRLDQYLKKALPGFSRARIQKAIRNGACQVEGGDLRDPDFRLRQGQKLLFTLEEDPPALKAEDGELKIIWQDEDLAVCDKGPNLTVHPCPSCPENTLVQRLLSRFPQLAKMGGERPGIVHRLDKDTSGLLLVALSEESRLKLGAAFAGRDVHKEYLALVAGVPPREGECLEPLGRHPEIKTKMAVVPENRGGRKAHSVWHRLWSAADGSFSLVAVKIHTGRTHQIRVHMAHMGHPILGDRLYAPPEVRDMAPRQMLHATRLELAHPKTAETLHFFSAPPDDFLECILNNSEEAFRLVLTGNPGCGKSTLARELARRGLPVIDADAIISKLYARPGHVTDWLGLRGFSEAIAPDGSVLKSGLLKLFESRPEIRKEFEQFVHALVRDEILEFWQNNREGLAAVAEVPLFFEAGWQKLPGQTMIVGIHSDQQTRFERLERDRGWSHDKIRLIEAWQMAEARKMSLCDLVYDNSGSKAELTSAAPDLLARLEALRMAKREKLLEEIKRLTGEKTDKAHHAPPA